MCWWARTGGSRSGSLPEGNRNQRRPDSSLAGGSTALTTLLTSFIGSYCTYKLQSLTVVQDYDLKSPFIWFLIVIYYYNNCKYCSAVACYVGTYSFVWEIRRKPGISGGIDERLWEVTTSLLKVLFLFDLRVSTKTDWLTLQIKKFSVPSYCHHIFGACPLPTTEFRNTTEIS